MWRSGCGELVSRVDTVSACRKCVWRGRGDSGFAAGLQFWVSHISGDSAVRAFVKVAGYRVHVTRTMVLFRVMGHVECSFSHEF